MLNNIPKLNDVSGRIDNWAEKFSAVKSALFPLTGDADYESGRISLQNTPRVNEHAAAYFSAKADKENIFASIRSNKSTSISAGERILENWDTQGEHKPNDDFEDVISDEDYKKLKFYMPPLLLGFNGKTDYVELEYSCVADPETGISVMPLVTVAASENGKSGHIYLNGTLAACVAGAADISASDVRLVKVEG